MPSKLEPLVWTDGQDPSCEEKSWPRDTEIIGIRLRLRALESHGLVPYYTTGLHAWFLDQVRQTDPVLSAYLHDGQSEKAFTISGLTGSLREQGGQWVVPAGGAVSWMVTGLTVEVVEWLRRWVQHLPPWLELRGSPLQIVGWEIALPPTRYQELAVYPQRGTLSLSFISPTSFRHRGHHLPLPIPKNLFHSYLRRWNDFSGSVADPEYFLEQVDLGVVIMRHRIESVKTMVKREGSLTGFMGCVQLGLAGKLDPEVRQGIHALVRFAPYCGTGHKTTFGLGQTRWGWLAQTLEVSSAEEQMAERIQTLTDCFRQQRVRQGGSRAEQTAVLWATILARREAGEGIRSIAEDLEMPYETVKSYVKLARRALQGMEG